MIIANGYIYKRKKQGGGLDSKTGFPSAPGFASVDKAPCQIITTERLNGRDGTGQPSKNAHYVVLVDGEYINEVETYRVSDENGSLLVDTGTAISVEYLRAVNQTKLTF